MTDEMTDVSEEFDRAKDLVKDIMAENPETRSNDWKLIVKILEKVSGQDLSNIDIETMRDEFGLPALMTCTRNRQTVQNEEGQFLPDLDTQAYREEREEEFSKETQRQKSKPDSGQVVEEKSEYEAGDVIYAGN